MSEIEIEAWLIILLAGAVGATIYAALAWGDAYHVWEAAALEARLERLQVQHSSWRADPDCPHIATVTEPRPGIPGLVTTCVTCKARVTPTKETP